MITGIDDLKISDLRGRQGEKWSHYPADVIPAWVADMDFEIAEPIRQAIIERVSTFDCGYPVAAADTGLREIFTERVERKFAWHVEPNQVELFNDVVQAIYFGLLALSNEDDGVLIQTPIYPPFFGAVEQTKRRVAASPLVQGNSQFEIDFEHLEAQLVNKNARILMLCNPHNPTGRCFTRQELERLAELVLAHELYVISDEIHADLVLDGRLHIPISSLDEQIAARTVTLMSASKAFNMAGVCMAFAVFGGQAIRNAFRKVPSHLRGGMSALSVAGVTAALTKAEPWLEQVLLTLTENRNRLLSHVSNEWEDITYHSTEATYLAWLDCRRLVRERRMTSTPYQYFLDKGRVALSEGRRFGEPGEGFVRLNFATSPSILGEILSRMDSALADH